MNWLDICALEEINALGSRIIAGPKGDIAIFVPATTKCSPLTTAARIRAARCPKAWSTASGWPARCTTGKSTWKAAKPWPRTSAVPTTISPGWKMAG